MTTPVPQRCVLVLPSTGEFDSRTYRIASTLAARGHTVTVIARHAPGLAIDERHPAGYRMLRVPVSAVDGLPGPLRGLARRLRHRRPVSVSPASPASPEGVLTPACHPDTGVVDRVRRAFNAAVRLAAIGLTVRSQRIATGRVAPMSDLVHAMAYMGPSVRF